ncbi:MAG: FG-GAP-like repeat-containing protein, partial [Ignavibacteria bacterium]
MKKLNLILVAVVTMFFLIHGFLLADTPVLKFTGAGPNSYMGISTKNAGDVNNDGFDDIIIGSSYNPAYNNPLGDAFIYFGGSAMDTIPDVIFHSQTINDNFGFCADGAGDVNGDGFDDVIIGAGNYVSGSGYGRAYIFFGGASMDNVPDVTIQGAPGDGYIAYFVSNAGDVNGDGFSDVMVNGSHEGYGRVFLYFGGASMDNIPDVTFESELATDGFPNGRLSKTGDVNNDGFDDVLIGASNYPCYSCPARGKVYLYYGGPSMDNVADLTMMGENTGQNYFGAAKEGGDVNGDGFVDLIVSDPNWGIWGTGNCGRIYVFYGGAGMDTIPDKIIRGQFDDDNFGCNVSSSDINNDGFDDIIVGASKFQYPLPKGKVYVYLGGTNMDTTADITHVGESDSSEYGEQVAAADVDGDGYKEYLVGASRYNGTVGRSYLYHLPDILKVTPSKNAINVTKSADIQVSFSKEMNASTISTSNIKVFGLQTGLKSTSVSYNAGTRTATINPSSDFKVGEKIQVTLSSGIETSTGTPITPFTWTFTVQA